MSRIAIPGDISLDNPGCCDSGQVVADAAGKSGKAEQGVPTIGARLGDLTADMRQSPGLPTNESGAVVEGVNPDKPAADAGLRPATSSSR